MNTASSPARFNMTRLRLDLAAITVQRNELLAALRDVETKLAALTLSGQYSVYTDLASDLSVARGIARAAVAKADGTDPGLAAHRLNRP